MGVSRSRNSVCKRQALCKCAWDGRRTSWLGGAGDDVVVVGEVDCQVALESRAPVVAPQAPLVLRGGAAWGGDGELACAAWARRRGPRAHVIGVDAQRGGDTVCDAQELAMWLCNGDLGGRSCVGRVWCQRGGGALPAVDARDAQLLDGLLVVGQGTQRAGARGPSRGEGCVVAVGGVVGGHGRESQSCSPLSRCPQRRPNNVGHGRE